MGLGRKSLKATKPKPYKEDPTTLGEHLKKRRTELRLTQRELAERLGVNEWTIGNWEKARTSPTVRRWPKVIELLGYDPNSEHESLGERLRQRRWDHGLSIREVAKRLRVDFTTYQRWEAGKRVPRGKWLIIAERFLDR